MWGDARVNIVSLCQIHTDHHEFMNPQGLLAYSEAISPSFSSGKTKAKSSSAVVTDSSLDDFTAWLK